MALYSGSNRIRGKLGDKIYKQINGKIFVTMAPQNVAYPTDDAAVLRWTAFSIAQKLTGGLRKFPAVVFFWKGLTRQKTVHGKIFKHIFPCIKLEDITRVTFLPFKSFDVSINSFSYLSGVFAAETAPLNSSAGIWPASEVHISMYCVLFLTFDVDDLKKKFTVISFSSDILKTELVNGLTFKAQLSPVQQKLIDSAKSAMVLYMFITFNQKGAPEKNSGTFTYALK